MLVHQRLRRVTVKQLGHDQEANILLAVQRLLEDMAAVTVGRKLDDAAPMRRMN